MAIVAWRTMRKKHVFACGRKIFAVTLLLKQKKKKIMDIFNRARLLMGDDVLTAVQQQRAIVFGTGGVGSWCIEGLVRSGISHITIVDSDCVAPSNINRQLMATTKTVGRPKVEVLRERLLEINPDAEVTAIVGIYNKENAADYHLEEYDIIVDAIDSLQEKADLIRHATGLTQKPIFVSAMGAALKMDPTKLQVAEFWKVKGCPLARALREKFKRQKSMPRRKFKCVYSEEVLPNRGAANYVASDRDTWAATKAATNGSMVHITATAGFMLAGIVMNEIYTRIVKG